MQPTFNPSHASQPLHHDVVLLDRWSVALNLFKRGDVVTLWSPQNKGLLTTKRIVALEGDLVSVTCVWGHLLCKTIRLSSFSCSFCLSPSFGILLIPAPCLPFTLGQVHPLPPSPPTPVRIPPGHCWVEGDSHFHSRDSNTYGPVSLSSTQLASSDCAGFELPRLTISIWVDFWFHVGLQVPLGLITAKVPYLVWPLKRFGPVDDGPEQKGRVRRIKRKTLDI
jgi:inner membrane protease subunit 2